MIVPTANRPYGSRVSTAMVRTSVHRLADAVCRVHEGWASGTLADDQRLRCSLAVLVRHLKRLIADLDCTADDDECCDRLAVLIERYYGCWDEYRNVCTHLNGLQRLATSK
jgi:hypothetical protein|uniref:Uncharacterized protein n=1 Tax=Sipha flava TaxID=143950 RepID=A0A2S2R849_9HEMI